MNLLNHKEEVLFQSGLSDKKTKGILNKRLNNNNLENHKVSKTVIMNQTRQLAKRD